uniref:Uncharacterized protein n=1 Tax=Pyxicephalus adspersus TaxID=30357 RepID=A0AAV3AD15_PYXAD|nr:TPA: hypothetical protein GDO54_013295 [Pyxicephalus adspersus]
MPANVLMLIPAPIFRLYSIGFQFSILSCVTQWHNLQCYKLEIRQWGLFRHQKIVLFQCLLRWQKIVLLQCLPNVRRYFSSCVCFQR